MCINVLGAVQLDASEQQAETQKHNLHMSNKQVEELSRKLYQQKAKVCLVLPPSPIFCCALPGITCLLLRPVRFHSLNSNFL